MIKFKDASGDEFVAHRNGDRVTVMRGCSVVMDAFVFDDNLNVIKSHDSAPSVLAVRIALGLMGFAEDSPKTVALSGDALDKIQSLVDSAPAPSERLRTAAKSEHQKPRKHKPLTVPIGDGKE